MHQNSSRVEKILCASGKFGLFRNRESDPLSGAVSRASIAVLCATFDIRYLRAHLFGQTGDLHGPLVSAADARHCGERVAADYSAGNVVGASRAAKGDRCVEEIRHRSLRRVVWVRGKALI